VSSHFEVGNALKFESGSGGLTRARISTPLANGEICLHGAHITEWTPCGERPILFLSSKSAFGADKAIRGGVPIVFPWFGTRADGQAGPAHGWARTAQWNVVASALRSDGVLEIALALAKEGFRLRFSVAMGTSLEMALDVQNESAAPARFEEAMHTYLSVGDVRRVSVTGLEHTEFLDKTDGFRRKTQPPNPVTIAKETDSVYLNTQSACMVIDQEWGRRIVVEKQGSSTTVVWNPWETKAAAINDLGPGEWQRMICVETANASENAITLNPGQSHRMTATIRLAD
jgi:glucose-6-phosphate 1-epimerase